MEDTHIQKFAVHYEYPVHFTRDVLAADNDLLCSAMDRLGEGRRHRAMVFIDSGVVAADPELVNRVKSYFEAHSDKMELACDPEIVPGGEKAKTSRSTTDHIMESIARNHLCRQSFVVAIGGGSALDIIGLAASLVHRGVRQIRIPTTVLSQNDSGVGVKNGIDAYGVKNFAGTFDPPFAVLIDFGFLKTLNDKYWHGGISEAYKVAIIKDRELFDYLCEHALELRARDDAAIEHVVKETALLHLAHIASAGDPFEFGASRPLDFGHWIAHRLEIISDYEIGHGQAVAVGIALDSYYAYKKDLISYDELDSIVRAMAHTGLPIWSDLLDRRNPDGKLEMESGLEDFREHLGGELHVTLPNGIGSKIEINEMDLEIVREACEFMKEKAEEMGGDTLV
jgi:3-dehydroquinate synthase